MNINVGREAFVNNPLKNNLRPLPKIDNEPFIEIDDQPYHRAGAGWACRVHIQREGDTILGRAGS